MDNAGINHEDAPNEMAERKSPQVTMTLSQRVYDDLEKIARWKSTPMATYLRQLLERYHESPECGELLKRIDEEPKKRNSR